MSDGPSRPGLIVDADLRVDVDGAHAQVRGSGDEIVIESPNPLHFARRARRGLPGHAVTPSGARMGAFADLFADNGVTARFAGPHTEWARIGAGVDSPVGGVLAGTRHIAIAPPLVRRTLAEVGAATVVILAWRWSRS